MYDLIIIGAGPAGISAAIYALRNNLKVGILEDDAPGGKVVYTASIENYPGFTQIDGPQLAYSMYEQMINFGVDYLGFRAQAIEKVGDHFLIKGEENIEAKKVIIATGTINRKLNLPGEDLYTNKGISWCAVCDGPLYKNQEVAVIGGGNSALEEAIYLSGVVKKVYIIHRRDEFRAESHVVEKVKKIDNIELILDSVVLEFIGDDLLKKLRIKNLKNGKESELEVAGCFEFIGLLPATDFIGDLGITDEHGYIVVDENQETKIKGLYGVGDVVVKKVRQIVTAVNDGAIAALHIIREIR